MTIAAIIEGKGHDVLTLPADALLKDAVTLLAERRIGALPVIKDDEICGMLSERDVITCLCRDGGSILDWTVDKLMTSPAITVAPDATVDEAMTLMTERRVRHLPVIESGALKGIVSIGDLVKAKIESAEEEAQAMRSYIQAS